MIHLPAQPRILVIRPDRLGDVVLSVPTVEALKRTYPRSHLSFWVQPRVAPVVRGLPFVDEVQEIEPDKLSLAQWTRKIREGRWDVALLLHPQFKIAAGLWWAGVPVRVGPLSKAFSYLFLNHGIRQHRSQVEMHEADYNLQLLSVLGVHVGSRTILPQVVISPEARSEVSQFFGDGASRPPQWVAIHPGMGGSALNWPESHYLALARELMEKGVGVVVTGGPAEQDLLDRFAKDLGEKWRDHLRVFGGKDAKQVDRLAAVFERVAVVVAPSTGPLHVAVALGRPVVTFYPPIRVQSARRWGPYVEDLPGRVGESVASVLVPQVVCGQAFQCLGQACRFYPCMSTLSVTDALELVQNHLKRL